MRLSFLGLFLVLFIDGMGQGILFPILIRDLTNPESVVLTASQSMVFRNSLYGIVLGVFFFCWFIGAPILGDLSDYVGRRGALMICLWGTLIGYVFSSFAFIVHIVLLLIIGRIIDGITAGDQPIAQAAAVDVSEEKTKTKNIGYVLLFLTLGIVCGPLIGGFYQIAKSSAGSTAQLPCTLRSSYLSSILWCCSSVIKTYCPQKKAFSSIGQKQSNHSRRLYAIKNLLSGFQFPGHSNGMGFLLFLYFPFRRSSIWIFTFGSFLSVHTIRNRSLCWICLFDQMVLRPLDQRSHPDRLCNSRSYGFPNDGLCKLACLDHHPSSCSSYVYCICLLHDSLLQTGR